MCELIFGRSKLFLSALISSKGVEITEMGSTDRLKLLRTLDGKKQYFIREISDKIERKNRANIASSITIKKFTKYNF